MLMLLIAAMLAACSADKGTQVTSTAVMGSALGIPAGPIGIAVGGVVGAATGALLPAGAFETPSGQS
jgi:hypothetical protein